MKTSCDRTGCVDSSGDESKKPRRGASAATIVRPHRQRCDASLRLPNLNDASRLCCRVIHSLGAACARPGGDGRAFTRHSSLCRSAPVLNFFRSRRHRNFGNKRIASAVRKPERKSFVFLLPSRGSCCAGSHGGPHAGGEPRSEVRTADFRSVDFRSVDFRSVDVARDAKAKYGHRSVVDTRRAVRDGEGVLMTTQSETLASPSPTIASTDIPTATPAIASTPSATLIPAADCGARQCPPDS